MPPKKNNKKKTTSTKPRRKSAKPKTEETPEESHIEELATIIEEIQEDHGEVLSLWGFPEYQKHDRGKWWYILAIGLSAILVVMAVLNNNLLFAVIIIIADIIIFLQAKNTPKDMVFVITEDGLLLHHKFYPFSDLENFWIAYNPPEVRTLYFKPKSGYRPTISVSLEDQNPIEIREILLKFLDEDLEQEDETTSDALSRLLRI